MLIKKFYQFTKKNNILCYVLLLLTYALLVNFHANIVDYFKIRFAPEAITLRETSAEGIKNLGAGFPQSLKSNYVNFEFDFKLGGEGSSDNLFQTAPRNQGIRLELSPAGGGMILADRSSPDKTVTFEINKVIIPNEWHHIKAEALQNEFIIINLDKTLVINTREYRPQFDISEIAFGKSYLDEKNFHGEIRNVNLTVKNVGEARGLDILLTLTSVSLILTCLYIISNSAEGAFNECLSQSGDNAYLRALFFVYIIYLGSFFVTNYFSKKEIPYWPIIIIVLAPFNWRWVSLSRLSVPVPAGLSLSEVRRNIDCAKTPAMAALFIYIANKAVVSWLLPSNQPLLDYFITEYFFGLALFFIGFIRLAVDLDNFFSLFFLWLSPLVAINGLINIYVSPFQYLKLLSFAGDRLSPSFGPGVDFEAGTSAALTYALYLYGLSIALIHMAIDQIRWRKISLFFSPCILILLCSIYMTHTRGAVLGLIVAYFSIIIIFLSHRRVLLVKTKTIALFVIVSALIFIPFFLNYFSQRNDSKRLEVWINFYSYIGKGFILGCGDRGFGRFENNSNLLLNVLVSKGETIHHWHNIFLNAWFRGGCIGIISLACFFIISVSQSVRFARSLGGMISLGTLIIFIIAGLFDFDLHIYPGAWMLTSNWVPLLMAAAAYSLRKINHDRIKIAIT